MDRINTVTKAEDLFGAGKHGFKDGDLPNAIVATRLDAEWFNAQQEEKLSVIEGGGVVPAAGNYTQLRQALKRIFGGNVTTVNAANSPFALTADHAGLVIMDGTAGNIVGNLPAANVLTVPVKYRFVRFDASTNSATVNRAGADTIPGQGTSFTLAGLADFREVESDTSAKWLTTAAPSIHKQIQSITGTVAGNALTLGLAASQLDFRNAALTSGAPTTVAFGALSLVVPSTATLGTVNGVQSRLILLAMNNAGAAELAVINAAGGVNLDETGVISTTAIAGGSNSATVAYSAAARANVPYRVVGYVESTQAAAGTWATAPSTLQGVGGQALATMSALGFGQTYQNVTGSRALGTTYYNTTGKPIFVVCTTSNGGGSTAFNTFTVDGVAVNTASTPPGGFAMAAFIVRPGQSYTNNNTGGFSLTQWVELR